jgi:hypothetical protein
MNEELKMIECACGSCDVEVITNYREFSHKGFVEVIAIDSCECQDCGVQFFTENQNFHLAMVKMLTEAKIEKYILDNPEE